MAPLSLAWLSPEGALKKNFKKGLGHALGGLTEIDKIIAALGHESCTGHSPRRKKKSEETWQSKFVTLGRVKFQLVRFFCGWVRSSILGSSIKHDHSTFF